MNCENEAKQEIDVTNHIKVGHSKFAFDQRKNLRKKQTFISQRSVDTVYAFITMLPT